MAGSVHYMMTRVSMAELEAMRDKDRHVIVGGIPGFYALDDTGGIHTYPPFDVTQGYLDRDDEVNQVCYVPGQRIDAFKKGAKALPCYGCVWGHGVAHVRGCPNAFRDFTAASRAFDLAQKKVDDILNMAPVPCNTRPSTLIGSSPDPIVSLVEFKGRLWVATSRRVFVMRENEDVFDPVEIIAAPIPQEGRAADEAAGLVPLHPNQTAEHADPFVPNKFGDH